MLTLFICKMTTSFWWTLFDHLQRISLKNYVDSLSTLLADFNCKWIVWPFFCWISQMCPKRNYQLNSLLTLLAAFSCEKNDLRDSENLLHLWAICKFCWKLWFHYFNSLLTLLAAFSCERMTWAWSTPPIPPPLLLAWNPWSMSAYEDEHFDCLLNLFYTICDELESQVGKMVVFSFQFMKRETAISLMVLWQDWIGLNAMI